jgi:F-type H+-transporting ATPase subunit b
MLQLLFAAEESGGSPLKALGVDGKSFLFQLITFVLVFLILKKVAFGPISKVLARRRQTIDEGVKAGLEFEKQRARMETEHADIVRKARVEADQIMSNAHKEARDVIRDAEKVATRKADSLLSDAEVRIHEESERAKLSLEKDIVGLVAEVTEAVVGQKIDTKKDAEIIDKILKDRIKK